MSLAMRMEGTERWTPRIRRLQAGFVAKAMIERELIESSLDEGVEIARRTLLARIGHLNNSGSTRFPDKPNTGTLWKSIRKTDVRLGSGKVLVDRAFFEGYFYPKVFEFGMRKYPEYYGRHFWQDSTFLMRRMFRKNGQVVLRRVRNHYAD